MSGVSSAVDRVYKWHTEEQPVEPLLLQRVSHIALLLDKTVAGDTFTQRTRSTLRLTDSANWRDAINYVKQL